MTDRRPTPDATLDLLSSEVVRVLLAAHGPMTVEEIRTKLGERLQGGWVGYGDVYVRLNRLAGRGVVDTLRLDRCRIWWMPTKLPRRRSA